MKLVTGALSQVSLPALLLAVVLLGGCSPVKVGQPGPSAWLYKNPKGGEFVVRTCPPTISGEECNKLPKVEFTTSPQDREAWQFEIRVKVRALIGIPYGRQPSDVIVVGSRTRCEEVRGAMAKVAGDPTEPCEGPLYFRPVQ